MSQNRHLAPVEIEADATPIWTERINIDSTIKDGYRVKEVTLTVQYQDRSAPSNEERVDRLSDLISRGEEVAQQANHQREQTNRFR